MRKLTIGATSVTPYTANLNAIRAGVAALMEEITAALDAARAA